MNLGKTDRGPRGIMVSLTSRQHEPATPTKKKGKGKGKKKMGKVDEEEGV